MDEKAEDYFRKSRLHKEKAEELLKEGHFPEYLSQLQKAIEYAFKSLLILYGIEFKPTHDVSSYVIKMVEKMSKDDPQYIHFRKLVPACISILRAITSLRGFADYGERDITSRDFIPDGIARGFETMFNYYYDTLIGVVSVKLYEP